MTCNKSKVQSQILQTFWLILFYVECNSVVFLNNCLIFIFFSSWDEWVPESRVLKYVDTNLQKQKELQKANQ